VEINLSKTPHKGTRLVRTTPLRPSRAIVGPVSIYSIDRDWKVSNCVNLSQKMFGERVLAAFSWCMNY